MRGPRPGGVKRPPREETGTEQDRRVSHSEGRTGPRETGVLGNKTASMSEYHHPHPHPHPQRRRALSRWEGRELE